MEGEGLPLIIPWAIVVLNVVVTMLNSLFERRREINILSSVGLNPAEIASIFVAEASIMGFIAGGLGYLLGLSFYRLMPLLGLTLEVQQKVSAGILGSRRHRHLHISIRPRRSLHRTEKQ